MRFVIFIFFVFNTLVFCLGQDSEEEYPPYYQISLIYFDSVHFEMPTFKEVSININKRVPDSTFIYHKDNKIFDLKDLKFGNGGPFHTSVKLKHKRRKKSSFVDIVIPSQGLNFRVFLDPRFKNIDLSFYEPNNKWYITYRNSMLTTM